MRSHPRFALLAAAMPAMVAWAGPAAAQKSSQCMITDSPCYPWRIEAGANETVLLDIIPNNAITNATYRVCLCPPTKGISVIFDFKERVVDVGGVPDATKGPVCRDFRIQTARSSRLLLRLPQGSNSASAIEGCYSSF